LDFRNIPPAANKYGHSSTLTCKVLPELASEVQQAIQSGHFPAYRTQSDLIRHAVQEHLIRLGEDMPGSVELDALTVVTEIMAKEQKAVAWLETTREAEGVLLDHLKHGRYNDATRLYNSLAKLIYELPDGEIQIEALNVLQQFDHLRATITLDFNTGDEA